MLDIDIYGAQGRGCYTRACAYTIHHHSFIIIHSSSFIHHSFIHVRTSKPKLVQAGDHASAAFTCVSQDVTPLAFHKIGLMLFYVSLAVTFLSALYLASYRMNEWVSANLELFVLTSPNNGSNL